jgi:hypothetical protein
MIPVQPPHKALVATHDRFATIATIKHMIHRSGEFDPTLEKHSLKITARDCSVSIQKSENHRLTPIPSRYRLVLPEELSAEEPANYHRAVRT